MTAPLTKGYVVFKLEVAHSCEVLLPEMSHVLRDYFYQEASRQWNVERLLEEVRQLPKEYRLTPNNEVLLLAMLCYPSPNEIAKRYVTDATEMVDIKK